MPALLGPGESRRRTRRGIARRTGVDEMGREEWEQGHGVLRSSRNQKVGRGAGSFIKARERPDPWACRSCRRWMWMGLLVAAQRGTDG